MANDGTVPPDEPDPVWPDFTGTAATPPPPPPADRPTTGDRTTEWPTDDASVPVPTPPSPPPPPPLAAPQPTTNPRGVILVAVVFVLVAGVGAFVALVALAGSSPDSGPDAVPTVAVTERVDTETVDVFDLVPGTCFDDGTVFDEDDDEVDEVPVVSCDGPHDNEIFTAFDLSDGPFPGSDEVSDQGIDGCIERFEDFVGRDYATSRYVVSSLHPTRGSWREGDREVLCFLYDIDLEKLVGSAEGTAE